jgi:hypothetical protein
MKTQTKKSKSGKCEFCSPESAPEICQMATAKTTIDGKEHAACCVKCSGNSEEEKPKEKKAKD